MNERLALLIKMEKLIEKNMFFPILDDITALGEHLITYQADYQTKRRQ